jgi:hypothetical protein
MKHGVEMGSGAMIYLHTKFHKIGSGIQKLMAEIQRQTAWRSHKPN